MAEQNNSRISYEEKIYRKYINFLNEYGEEMEETGNWNKIFEVLNRISIHPDYVLDDYRKKNSTDNVLQLFARHKSSPSFRECEEKKHYYFSMLSLRPKREDEGPFFPPFISPYQMVILDKSPKSLWQAFLLQNTYHFAGMRGKASIEKQSIVFSENDAKPNNFGEGVLDYDKIKNILFSPPKISLDAPLIRRYENDEIDYLEYCYWSDKKGLVRVKLEILYNYSAETVSFETVSSKVLYKYNCRKQF